MSGPQKCVACGYVGWDVGPRLVRLKDSPEPFAVQVRCVDSEACADRQLRDALDTEREAARGD